MNIEHDVRQMKFYTILDGKEYSLEYNVVEKNLWEFHCPFFLNEIDKIRERDIKEELIEYALRFMARNNILILESGSCHQVKDYLDRKKDLQFLLKITEM
jgi:hypothetical protein